MTGTLFLTDDIRLTRALTKSLQPPATLNEYAQRTGISVDHILTLLRPHLDAGTLDIEAVGGEIFLHTAPQGRPGPPQLPQAAPNLWETLRSRYDRATAFAVWRLTRQLQDAGWSVENQPTHIPAARGGNKTPVGLHVSGGVLPVLVHPKPEELAGAKSPLTDFDRRGIGALAITCPDGKLDTWVTAVRTWMLTRFARTRLHVLILEEPRYTPVLLSPDDSSLSPRSISVEQLEKDETLLNGQPG